MIAAENAAGSPVGPFFDFSFPSSDYDKEKAYAAAKEEASIMKQKNRHA